MKLFKQIFEFYINSSIHVSLAVLCLTLLTILEYELNLTSNLLLFIFFGSISGYNFVKYVKVAGMHHRSLTNSLKTIQVFSVVCFVILVFLGSQLSIRILLVFTCFAILTFFYAVPFIRKKSLRKLSRIKIFIVAIVWAGITVLVPLISEQSQFTIDNWISFLQIVLIVVTLILPFEIRDIPFDDSKLKTLAQGLGIKGVKLLGWGLLVAVMALELLKTSSTMEYQISLIITILIIAVFLLISKIKQPKYFASFWVESIPIYWVLIYYLI